MPEQVGQGAVMHGQRLGYLEEPDQAEPVQALCAADMVSSRTLSAA